MNFFIHKILHNIIDFFDMLLLKLFHKIMFSKLEIINISFDDVDKNSKDYYKLINFLDDVHLRYGVKVNLFYFGDSISNSLD